MTVKTGDVAPDFTLPDQHGVSTMLSRQTGPVLIVFFPAAFTPVCHDELRALRAVTAHVDVLAVSCDSMYVLRTLDEAEQLGFPLLSDFWPHGEVTHAYGAFDDARGTPQRASFLVDGQGRIAATWRSTPDRPREAGDYLAAVAALTAR